MFGRTLKIAIVLAFVQLSSGCCWCWRPFLCHRPCGGCAPAACSSCYTPSVAPAMPVMGMGMGMAPPVSVMPTTVGPMPSATANNPTVGAVPFNSATYTHPTR